VGDAFGISVAGLGDLTGDSIPEWIVGARSFDRPGKDDAGRAYLYSGCQLQPIEILEGEHAGDRFGWTVAAAGDVDVDGVDDYVIAAPRSDKGGEDSGRVYVYSGLSGQSLFRWKGAQEGEHFGLALAAAGDVDQDGFADVLIGAPRSDSAFANMGRAAVYSGESGKVLLEVSGNFWLEELGTSVAGAGDFDQDGYDDFMVGSFNGGLNYQGEVQIFSGFDGSSLQTWTGEQPSDAFGSSLVTAGDVNGDGLEDYLVGATQFNATATGPGSAYLYSGCNAGLLWHFESDQPGDRLGVSLAGSFDANQDGLADVAAGAYLHDGGGFDAGRTSVYAGNDLYLKVTPEVASPGETLSIQVRGGEPGQPVLLVLTEANGLPFFLPLFQAALDNCGNFQLNSIVPAKMAALNLKFQAWTLKGGELADSLHTPLTLN
jgi:hypothetical protein